MTIATAIQILPGSISDIFDAVLIDGEASILSFSSARAELSAEFGAASVALVGSGFTLDGNDEPVAGTITALEFYADSSATTLLGRITGLNFGLVAFVDALDADAGGNSGPLDTLFATIDFDYTGSSGDDVNVPSGIGPDTIDGGAGNDVLEGFEGDDSISGGAGDDTINGDRGFDTLDGGTSPDDFDVLINMPTDGALIDTGIYAALYTDLVGDPFFNVDTVTNFELIEGTDLEDVVMGGADNIQLRTFAGEDWVLSSAYSGTDTGGVSGRIEVRYDNDADYGGTDGVYVNLNQGYAIDGFGDEDLLAGVARARGTDQADILIGSVLDNRLRGGDGEDTLVSGAAGSDELRGEGGIDTFMILGGGDVTITDLEAGETLDFSRTLMSQAQIDAILSAAGTAGDDTVLNLADGGTGLTGTVTLRDRAVSPVTFQTVASAGAVDLTVTQLGEGDLTELLENAVMNGDAEPGGTATSFTISDATGQVSTFTGTGFTYDFEGEVESGTITGLDVSVNGTAVGGFTVTSGTLSVDQLADAFLAQDAVDDAFQTLEMKDLTARLTAITTGADGVDTDLLTTDGDDSVTGGDGDEYIYGADGDDTIAGGAGDDYIYGAAGDDSLDGGAGEDVLVYDDERSALGVNINVATGIAIDGRGGTDTFVNFEHYVGTLGADTFTGGTGDDVFFTGGGNDVINGGAGSGDWALWNFGYTNGLTIDLAAGLVERRYIDDSTDEATITNVENIVGSWWRDIIIGDTADNILDGGQGGNDTFTGGAGSDTFVISTDGGTITDFSVTQDSIDLTRFGLDSAGAQSVVAGAFERGDDLVLTVDGSEIVIENADLSLVSPQNNITVLTDSDLILEEQLPDIAEVDYYASVNFTASVAGVLLDIDDFSPDYVFQSDLAFLPDNAGTLAVQLDGFDFAEYANGGTVTRIALFDISGGGRTLLADLKEVNVDLLALSDALDAIEFFGDDSQLAALLAEYRYDIDAVTLTEGVLLEGNDFADTVRGGAGDDDIFGYNGDDLLEGTDGDDGLTGGRGDDTLDGGAGIDFIDYFEDNFFNGAGGVTVNLQTGIATDGFGDTDTLISIEEVSGSNTDDTLIGSDTEESGLYGNGGNDLIVAGDGGSYIIGSVGDDTIVGGTGYDQIAYNTEEGSNGIVVDLAGGTATDVNGDTDTLSDIEAVRGTGYDDEIRGDDGSNMFRGLGGDDTLNGLGGDDTLEGGAGNDELSDGDGDDSVSGGDGDDRFLSGSGGDTFDGGAGNDTLVINTTGSDPNAFTSTIDLVAGTNSGTFDATLDDVLISIENVAFSGPQSIAVIGTDGDNVLTLGDGADTVFSGAGSDVVSGGSGGDFLVGGAGADTLEGGLGLDSLYGGVGADVISGGDGADLVGAGADDDYVTGGAGGDRLFGEDGHDTLEGGGDHDELSGGAGEDVLNGGDGNDLLIGQQDNDILIGDQGNDTLYGQIGADDLSGGDGADTLAGGDGIDTLDGGAGDDGLYGEAGNDLLTGGAGADQLWGGDGDDTLAAGDDADLVIAGLGADMASGGLGDDDIYGQAGNDTLDGDDGADLLAGGDDADLLRGGLGDDDLYGEAGVDTLDGGAGADTLWGGSGDDSMDGGAGDDQMIGQQDNDTMSGNAGNDLLFGQLGDDFLFGNDGIDTLAGGDGADVLEGGADRDFLYGEAGADTLDGGAGDDELRGGSESDLLRGGDGTDILIGEGGGDTLEGGAGNDALYGLDDADRIWGGAGNDGLVGGSGADTFVFATGDGIDTVYDYEAGVDMFDLTGLGLTSQAQAEAAITQQGADVWIAAPTEVLVVLNATEADVEAQSTWII